jgi:hypothetical protein
LRNLRPLIFTSHRHRLIILLIPLLHVGTL